MRLALCLTGWPSLSRSVRGSPLFLSGEVFSPRPRIKLSLLLWVVPEAEQGAGRKWGWGRMIAPPPQQVRKAARFGRGNPGAALRCGALLWEPASPSSAQVCQAGPSRGPLHSPERRGLQWWLCGSPVVTFSLSPLPGPLRWPERELHRRPPLAAVLAEPGGGGGVLLGAPAVPHAGLGLPAALLPAAVPAAAAALRAEPGGRQLPAPGRPLRRHQPAPPAPAERLALAAGAPRGSRRRPPLADAPGARPGPAQGLPGRATPAARPGRRGARLGRRAAGAPRPGPPQRRGHPGTSSPPLAPGGRAGGGFELWRGGGRLCGHFGLGASAPPRELLRIGSRRVFAAARSADFRGVVPAAAASGCSPLHATLGGSPRGCDGACFGEGVLSRALWKALVCVRIPHFPARRSLLAILLRTSTPGEAFPPRRRIDIGVNGFSAAPNEK